MSLNPISYSLPPELDDAVKAKAEEWRMHNLIARIWDRDSSVWTSSDESKWLGWLTVAEDEKSGINEYREFHSEIKAAGFENILLLGMGGSSLCPEVLAKTFGIRNFAILDSTVPEQIIRTEKNITAEKTLFIVSSKSGTTLEPNSFLQYFYQRMSDAFGEMEAGKRFAAVTDPGTPLEKTARELGFRRIFFGQPDIGGRFSALSAFGLAPASSMGLDVNVLLSRATQMAEVCRRVDPAENPGALLGVVLGVCQQQRIDKLTIFASKKMSPLGAWLEQLIAESTGKNGVAIIPIDAEPPVSVGDYGQDRIFVFIGLRGEEIESEIYDLLSDLESAGRPVVRIEAETEYHISQEFFRWEFATAVAGAIMAINPFDQPDVESAKTEARKITQLYEQTGVLPQESPFFIDQGVSLFADPANRREIESIAKEDNLSGLIKAHLDRLRPNDYFALLAFLDMSRENIALCSEIRRLVLETTRAATCLGFGPRFLHSTGQAFKGGPNTGVFLQVTADDKNDLPVPGQKYTFGVIKAAQAAGDLRVLFDRGRRALRINIGNELSATDGLRLILDSIRS